MDSSCLVYYGASVREGLLRDGSISSISLCIDLESSLQQEVGSIRCGHMVFILDKKLLVFLRKRNNVQWQTFLHKAASVHSSPSGVELEQGVPHVTAVYYCLPEEDLEGTEDLFEGLAHKIVSSEQHLAQVLVEILHGQGDNPLRTSTPCKPQRVIDGPTVGVQQRLTFSDLDRLDEGFSQQSPRVVQSEGLQGMSSGHLADGTFSSAREVDCHDDTHSSPTDRSTSLRSEPVGETTDNNSSVSSYLRAGNVSSLDPTRSMSSLGLDPSASAAALQNSCRGESGQLGRPTHSQPHAFYSPSQASPGQSGTTTAVSLSVSHAAKLHSNPFLNPGGPMYRGSNPFRDPDNNIRASHGLHTDQLPGRVQSNSNNLIQNAPWNTVDSSSTRSSDTSGQGMAGSREAAGVNFNRDEPSKDFGKSFDDNNMQMSFPNLSTLSSLGDRLLHPDSQTSARSDPTGGHGGATHFPSLGTIHTALDKASDELRDDTLVMDLPQVTVEYLCQELDIGPQYGQGWQALASLKGYRFSQVHRIDGNSRICSPFKFLLGQQQFSGYTLGHLKEDLCILPRLDILHHLAAGSY